MWSMALLLSAVALVTAGCGGGGGGRDPILGAGGIAELAVPKVTLTVPTAGATNVAIDTKVTATFNKDMDPATISGTTFTLAGPGTTVVPGVVTYDVAAKTATFKPTTPTDELLANTKYTATVTTGAKDTTGVALASNFVWVFTTLANAAPPTVTAVNPIDPSSTACLTKVINATFSRSMDPSTINSSPAGTLLTFTITTGGIDVPGTVAYDVPTKVASFTATSDLAAGNYTATITTAAKDLAGIALTADKVWTFTGTGVACASPPVAPSILGTVSRFGIFGGTAGMTNKGTQTLITGSGGNTADIGTIATDTSAVTGFQDSALDVYTVVPGVNQGIVTGKIYTCTTSTTGPTNPTNGVNAASCATATQARLDAQTAYLALAAMPDSGLPVAANLAGLTLAPGVYKAPSGSFLIEGGDLTLDAQGDANAVFVFQMATTLTVGGPGAAAPQSVKLINGALAKNVFWQVGSAAIINAGGGGTMVGTIISQAGAAFSTAGNVNPVTLNGRALSLGASVTLVNTVINVPAP
ncbi:MAG: hypothetical protein A3E79_09770 [Burkholderiales bacterium RIFCSPHIGHO2_12_FULL_61_11]|nr:MAG: hypothetical protein A3E79_09770 [Burkholderiales bacterium RIFCSPHIGHO2_12_FULL_61_11]